MLMEKKRGPISHHVILYDDHVTHSFWEEWQIHVLFEIKIERELTFGNLSLSLYAIWFWFVCHERMEYSAVVGLSLSPRPSCFLLRRLSLIGISLV